MSLINDMLRELDRRGAPAPLPAAASVPLPPSRRRRLGLVIALLLALLALPALGWWMARRLPLPLPAEALPTAETPPSVSPPASSPTSAAPVASGPAPAPDDTTQVVQVVTASEAIEDTPPTGTEDRNATTAAAPPAPVRASAAVDVAPPAPPMSERVGAAAVVEAAAPAGGRPATAVTTPQRMPASAAAPVTVDRGIGHPPPGLVDPTAAPPAAPPLETIDAPASRLSIRPHAPDSARDSDPDALLREADAALAARRDDRAEHLLQLALAAAPAHHRARLLLAGLYSAGGRHDAAMALLEGGLALAPDESSLADRLGRLLLQRGDPVRAAAVLAKALPPLAEQPDQHALLALAWQQAGQPAAAARVYQALVDHDAGVAAWWLGLGLARDGNGDRGAARQAYRQAERIGGLEAGVMNYVRQRINELEGEGR